MFGAGAFKDAQKSEIYKLASVFEVCKNVIKKFCQISDPGSFSYASSRFFFKNIPIQASGSLCHIMQRYVCDGPSRSKTFRGIQKSSVSLQNSISAIWTGL